MTRLRGAARGGDRRPSDDLVDVVRAVLVGMGWTPEAPTARGQTRDRWESLQALVDQAAGVRRAPARRRSATFVDDLDRRAAEQHAPVADGVTLATLHAAKGLEWDAVFLVRPPATAPCRSPTPRRRPPIEEERRLLYVGMTRARRDLARLVGARPATPAAAAPASPRGSSTRCCPQDALRAGRKPPKPQGRPDCRECGKPLATGAEKKRGRCADCPASYDEELFERLRAVAHRAGRARRACRRSWSSPTPRSQLIAEHTPAVLARACCTISGIGQAKLERYGEDAPRARRLSLRANLAGNDSRNTQ